MKSHLIVLFLGLFLVGCSFLKKPLVTVEPTLLKANEDVVALKNEVSGKMSAVEGDLTGVRGDLSGIKGDVSGLKGDIGKVFEANLNLQSQIKATLDLNAKAIAGFQNQIQETKTTAGRDVTQTTTSTNDTELMKYIVKGLIGLCSTLIGILGWCLRAFVKRGKEKKFYKEETLLRVQTQTERRQLRERHNEFVNGGSKK